MNNSSTTGGRARSLDVLRGLTVALMIVVNNPGSWSRRFDCLRHSAWDGCTPTDLVFPFFLFIVGASMWFAFRKYEHRLTAPALRKIVVRGFAIWAVGILLSKFPYYDFQAGAWIGWSDVRILGVLPRIGLAYMLGSLIVLSLRRWWQIVLTAVGLMTLYEGLVYALGDATLAGYIGRSWDVALLGEAHIYHGYGCPFDPEGVMSTLTATVNVLFGFLAARLVACYEDRREGMVRLGAWGGVGIVIALALNTFIPINKPIWSASYVLYTCGIAAVVWNIVARVTDNKGSEEREDRKEKPALLTRCCEVFGTNALAAYVLSGVYVRILSQFRVWDAAHENLIPPYARWYEILADATTPEIGSLLAALSLVALCWVTLYPLYRRKIYIKL